MKDKKSGSVRTDNKNRKNRGADPAGVTPFLRANTTTADCMFLVILAMLPSAGFGIYHYGVRAMFLIGLGVASAVISELLCDLILRRELTIFDYSAVVTGLCVGMIMPPSAPYRFPVIASAIAIIGAKMCFGGIGRNILNPAAVGKLVLLLLFPSWMNNFGTQDYSAGTPLMDLAKGQEIHLLDMLLGNVPGCIGTTSVLAVLIGALLLVITGVIDLNVSVSAVVSFAVFYVLFGQHGLSPYFLGAQLAGGSFLFTVLFMANDYTTSPVGRNARIVYGMILGVLTGVLRVFFGQEENASLYALLVCNALARFLDAKLMPKAFGTQQVRRTIRVHAPMPALSEAQEKTPEELEKERIEADFAHFEEQVLPRNAASGSETAGTIDQASVEMNRNRARIDQNIPPMPEMPVFGAAYDPYHYGPQAAGTAGPLYGAQTQPGDLAGAKPMYGPEAQAGTQTGAGPWYGPQLQPGNQPVVGPLYGQQVQPGNPSDAGQPYREQMNPDYGYGPWPGAGQNPGNPMAPGQDGNASWGQQPAPGSWQGQYGEQDGGWQTYHPGANAEAQKTDEEKGIPQESAEPVSRDTSIMEVEEILRAEQQMKRGEKDVEFASLDFIDISRSGGDAAPGTSSHKAEEADPHSHPSAKTHFPEDKAEEKAGKRRRFAGWHKGKGNNKDPHKDRNSRDKDNNDQNRK